jgi:hypothetical protein
VDWEQYAARDEEPQYVTAHSSLLTAEADEADSSNLKVLGMTTHEI